MEIKIRHRNGRCYEYLDRNGKWKSTKEWDKEAAMLSASIKMQNSIGLNFGDFATDMMVNTSYGSWLDTVKKLNKMRQQSIDNMFDNLRYYVIPYFKNMDISEITTPAIQAWYMNIKKKNGEPLSANTSNRALEALSNVMCYALMLNLIDHNPCEGVMKMKKNSSGHPIFTEEELAKMFPRDEEKLIEIYGSLDYALFYMISIDTGFRPGETAGLSVKSYHPKYHGLYTTQTCTKRTKELDRKVKTSGHGYNDRTGFLSPFTEKIFKKVIAERDDLIFINKNGKLIGQEAFGKKLDRVLLYLGIPKNGRSLYSFRSTFFTRMLRDYSDDTAMAMMGHKNWHSCYDHRTPEDVLRRESMMLASSNIKAAGEIYPDRISRDI